MTSAEMHWTSRSNEDFQYRIAMDFVVQLEKKMDADGTNQKKLAACLKVSAGRVSQVLNNPGRLNLESIVQYARALGIKVAVVAYDDNDPFNIQGPTNSEIFSMCWHRAGCPKTFFDLEDSAPKRATIAISLGSYIHDWKTQEPLTVTNVVARGITPGNRWDEGSATQQEYKLTGIGA